MSDFSFMFAEPQTDAECEAVLAEIMAEIERLNQMMRNDDIEIARLKAESQEWKEESERLKAEGRILDLEIRTMLERMEAETQPC